MYQLIVKTMNLLVKMVIVYQWTKCVIKNFTVKTNQMKTKVTAKVC